MLKEMLFDNKGTQQVAEEVAARLMPQTIEAVLKKSMEDADLRNVKTAIENVAKKVGEKAQKQLQQIATDEIARVKETIFVAAEKYGANNGMIEKMLHAAVTDALKEILPAVYKDALPRSLEGYRLIRPASFAVFEYKKNYTKDWVSAVAANDCMDEALKVAETKGIYAGAVLGAQAMVITNKSSHLISSKRIEVKDQEPYQEITTSGIITVEFYDGKKIDAKEED